MAGNIAEYNAGTNVGLRPSETGIEALTQAAYRGGRFFQESARFGQEETDRAGQEVGSGIAAVGDAVVQYQTAHQISAGAPVWTTKLATMLQSWNKMASSDPNDLSIADKFKTDVFEPQSQDFINSFSTEQGHKWAQDMVDRARQQFYGSTIPTTMASRAKSALEQNMTVTTNGMVGVVANNPTQLDFMLKNVDATVGPLVDAAPGIQMYAGAEAADIKGQLTHEMRSKIISAAVIGWAQRGAAGQDMAKKILADPHYQTDIGESVPTLTQHLNQMDELSMRQTEFNQHQTDRADTSNAEQAAFGILTKLGQMQRGEVPWDNNFLSKATFNQAFFKSGNNGEPQRIGEELNKYIYQAQSAPPKGDWNTFAGFQQRIASGEQIPFSDILTAGADRKLSPEQVNTLWGWSSRGGGDLQGDMRTFEDQLKSMDDVIKAVYAGRNKQSYSLSGNIQDPRIPMAIAQYNNWARQQFMHSYGKVDMGGDFYSQTGKNSITSERALLPFLNYQPMFGINKTDNNDQEQTVENGGQAPAATTKIPPKPGDKAGWKSFIFGH